MENKIYNFMEDELISFLTNYIIKDLSKIITEYYDPVPFANMRYMSLEKIKYLRKKYKDCSNKKGCYLLKAIPTWNIYYVACENSNHEKIYVCNLCLCNYENSSLVYNPDMYNYKCNYCYVHEVL